MLSRMEVVSKLCIKEVMFILWCLCDMSRMIVSEDSFVF